MFLPQHGFLGRPRDAFSVVVIGDSNATGAAASITSVNPNILYLWNGTSLTEITTQTVSNDGNYGSMWQSFSTRFNQFTGRRINLINAAYGGSGFCPAGDNNDWSTTGTRYTGMQSALATYLLFAGRTKPDLFIVNLGINDVRAARSFALMQTHINSLGTRLSTDYPGVPVVFIPPGRHETAYQSNGLANVRWLIWQLVGATTNFYMCGQPAAWTFNSGYEADDLHYNQTMSDAIGVQLANWTQLSGYTKWARASIASFFNELSVTRKDALAALIDGLITDGSYDDIDQFLLFNTSNGDNRNILLDVVFKGFGINEGATIVANDCIQTDGVSTKFSTTWNGTTYNQNATAQDVGSLIYIQSGSGVANTHVFGCFDGAPRVFSLGLQGTPTTFYRVHDATISLGAESSFASGNWYGIDRSVNTKRLLKNKTINASTTQASTGQVQGAIYSKIGCINGNGTDTAFFAGQFKAQVFYKASGFDKDSFQDRMATFFAAW